MNQYLSKMSQSNINMNQSNEQTVQTNEQSVETSIEQPVEQSVKTSVKTSVNTEKDTEKGTEKDTEKVSVKKAVKKSYLKTKVFYKFSKKSAKETLSEIKSRTDDLKSIGAPTMMTNGVCETVNREDYIKDLLYEINKATVVYYGTLNAPEEGSINKKVIGKGGCYFYKTTYDNNIFFIWHNKDTKSYEFWGGDYYGMINSMNAISHRIEKSSE